MNMTTGVVLVDDATQTRAAVAGFLAGYCGATRRSYATDLRIFAAWCEEPRLKLFNVRRAHLELFGRWMEENGKMRSTVARRLSTLASFYRYCEQEGLIDRNPAANVRRPKADYESRTLGLDRNELGSSWSKAARVRHEQVRLVTPRPGRARTGQHRAPPQRRAARKDVGSGPKRTSAGHRKGSKKLSSTNVTCRRPRPCSWSSSIRRSPSMRSMGL